MWTFVLTALSCGVAWINALECGKYVPRVSPRIIGGEPAGPGEFPWQVSIHLFGRHHCGGSIITENWVVSAAHCFRHSVSFDKFDMRAGVRDIRVEDRVEQTRKIARVIMHPAFASSGTLDHDIALVKPTTPFDFASSQGFIGSVCLPETAQKVGENLSVSGWGRTKESLSERSRLLRCVEVPVVDGTSCRVSLRQSWDHAMGQGVDPNSVVCAGWPNGGRDSCQMDSGGPAVEFNRGRAVLQGIVSWGEGCARPGKPGVYTAVLFFVPWIAEMMRSLE